MNQNPGAWTPPSIESAAQPGRQASQEHLMALFVGEKYQRYYQAKFAKITPKKLLSGFNIGAFFFGVIWLFYRKMYLYGFAALGLIIAVSLIEIALKVEGHGSGIGLAVFFGLMSNSRRHQYRRGHRPDCGCRCFYSAEQSLTGAAQINAEIGFSAFSSGLNLKVILFIHMRHALMLGFQILLIERIQADC